MISWQLCTKMIFGLYVNAPRCFQRLPSRPLKTLITPQQSARMSSGVHVRAPQCFHRPPKCFQRSPRAPFKTIDFATTVCRNELWVRFKCSTDVPGTTLWLLKPMISLQLYAKMSIGTHVNAPYCFQGHPAPLKTIQRPSLLSPFSN